MRNANTNTRALISALRSDHVTLRKAAIGIIDKAIKGSKRPLLDLQVKFDASRPTAYSLLAERKRFAKNGRLNSPASQSPD